MAKRLLIGAIACFVILNLIVLSHAYHFTHFQGTSKKRTKIESQSGLSKLGLLIKGVQLPKRINKRTPSLDYKEVEVNSAEKLACWDIPKAGSEKIILLFHGYGGEKSSLLANSKLFHQMGYHTFLTDFRGSGSSEGNATTLGFEEAKDVKSVYDYVVQKYPKKDIILYGFSMGAVAILKAVADLNIKPTSMIAEAPFSSLKQATINRFEMMGLPAHPFSEMLIFYGGALHGFNAFSHDVVEYASRIKVPCLIQRGMGDNRVKKEETAQIFKALNGKKKLQEYPNSGHFYYLWNDEGLWKKTVSDFLD